MTNGSARSYGDADLDGQRLGKACAKRPAHLPCSRHMQQRKNRAGNALPCTSYMSKVLDDTGPDLDGHAGLGHRGAK
jgi:hypothetical protein